VEVNLISTIPFNPNIGVGGFSPVHFEINALESKTILLPEIANRDSNSVEEI
jgi:hypothetical protein